ncbi:type I methionine aminopeptidase [Planoprotostelium fungivorum]|uniref:Methionine aminopeptidase n=1 Tax=Planoprotostelium fungivorum TaxID=1890364 RepID=A0A2P6N0C1_9EUKA|nr:type I methionine aminopeptidase [Planoprotostelium fungivorum]
MLKSISRSSASGGRFFSTGRRKAIRLGKVGPPYFVPPHVNTPEYANHAGAIGSRGPVFTPDMTIPLTVKREDWPKLREISKIVRGAMDHVRPHVVLGKTTEELDLIVFRYLTSHGAYPSSLYYGPKENAFPKSICTSINEVLAHGIPDDRPLENGDIINIDFAAFKDGLHSDMSETFIIGEASDVAKKLVQAARGSLQAAISRLKPGEKLSVIGEAIEEHCHTYGFHSHDFVSGHGIGYSYHGPPVIEHSTRTPAIGLMTPGMVFTIEPLVGEREAQPFLLSDGWTIVSSDASLSAQFEHTILIMDDGVEVLTGP